MLSNKTLELKRLFYSYALENTAETSGRSGEVCAPTELGQLNFAFALRAVFELEI